MRRLFFTAGFTAIGFAIAVVPVPLLVVSPAPVVSLPEHVSVDGLAGTLSGDLMLTGVRLEEPSLAEAAAAWLDRRRDLTVRPRVVPPGVDEEEFGEFQRRLFDESVTVAAAVAMSAAGLEVAVSGGGARVVGIIEGSPADGVLRQGDVITHVDGEEVQFATTLVARTDRARSGDVVELRVGRGDETFSREVELAQVDELGRPALGVAVQTLEPEIRLPREIDVALEGIGGPSGGLMLALTVYELVTDDDVVAGRTVAGTGTIDLAGRVGQVSEVGLKVVAAQRAGADLFLVPATQASEAEAEATSIEVVGVATLDEALEALRR